jgi:hypothetical protein
MGTGFYIFMAIMGCLMVVANYYENAEKEKREQRTRAAKQWNGVSVGLTKPLVRSLLGEPHKILQLGEQEIWGYGPTDQDGTILFIDGKVVGYSKPAILSPTTDDGQPPALPSPSSWQPSDPGAPPKTQQDYDQVSLWAILIVLGVVGALIFVILAGF